MKKPPLVTAVILLAALAGLALMTTPGAPQAQTGPTLSVDTDTTGNSANSVSSIEPCRSVASGSGSLKVDITIQGVASLSGIEADLFYNPAVLNVTGMQDNFILPQGIFFFNLSDPVPDSDGTFHIVLATTGEGSGDGVITRLTLQPVGDGTSPLDLANVDLRDFNNNPVTPAAVLDGSVAVGALCAADSDGDGVPDASDNCPDVANGANEAGIPGVGNQTNTDAALAAAGATIAGVPLTTDALGDACDPDDDNDGATDALEQFVMTNQFDNCPGLPGTGGDAWAPDMFDANGIVNALDALPIVNAWLTADPDPAYNQRADIFDGNSIINALDVLPIANAWLTACT